MQVTSVSWRGSQGGIGIPEHSEDKQTLAKGNLPNWYTGTPKTRGTQIATSADGIGRVLPGSKNTPFQLWHTNIYVTTYGEA